MDGSIQVYYGDGRGKTTAALGLGIRAASVGKQVIMIQFLKSKHSDTIDFLKRLEPNLQIFRFDKAACCYSELSEEERQEQVANIKNALAYARKVLSAGQCDVLILDELLGLIDFGIISKEECLSLINLKDEAVDLVLTGRHICEEVAEIADCIYLIHTEKEERKPEILPDNL